MGMLCFLSNGETSAFLYMSGNFPSTRERFMILVTGTRRLSRQDLRRDVGIMSKLQEASEEARMADFTSSVVAG